MVGTCSVCFTSLAMFLIHSIEFDAHAHRTQLINRYLSDSNLKRMLKDISDLNKGQKSPIRSSLAAIRSLALITLNGFPYETIETSWIE